MIYSIAMAQWRNPNLFSIEQLTNNNRISQSDDDLHNIPPQKNIEPTETQAKNTGALDESIRQSLLTTITKHMVQEQTFLDSQLTLTRLAKKIGITTHHLSEVLNQQEGKNFYQFINEYRISYFCQKLAQEHSLKLVRYLGCLK